MASFSFVLVDAQYCNYLRQFDSRVPYNMNNKINRPFVGILFSINNIEYYAPLSFPKPKHLTMNNQVDVIKINNGQYGIINLNNMIPVHINSTSLINIKINPNDTPNDKRYKNLLLNQLIWCNKNANKIIKQANRLYNMIINNKAWDKLADRCCNYIACENALKQYCVRQQWTI